VTGPWTVVRYATRSEPRSVPTRTVPIDRHRLARGLERREVLQDVERAQARDVERGDAAGRATLREQEAAVLLEHPAYGPHDVVARPAADVRDVEAVAHDAHAAARDALRARRPRRVAQPGRLEGALQVGGGDLVAERRQRVVHARLLVGPRRDRDPAVLAGGDDVERRVGVVAGARGRGAGEQQDERRDQGASPRGGAGHEANSPAPCARSHAKMTPASTLERETSA